MSPINKMAGARSWCGGFQDKSFAFQDWKYADKRHKWKEKVQKNAQFPFVDKRKLFALKCLSKNSTLFSTRRIGALGLFLTNQGSEASEDTWGTFRTLWSKKSVRFQKGIFEFIKVSWTFSTFWHRRERKTTKCAFEIDFLPCARPIQHAWTQRFNLS